MRRNTLGCPLLYRERRDYLTALHDALAGVELGDGAGRAYLAGELSVVSAMRVSLLDRGFDATRIAPKSYWRAGVANASHGEPPKDGT